MKLADIPSLTIRPVDAEPSKIHELLKSRAIGRRGILKGAAGAAMVLGITALDLIPGRNNAYASRQGTHPWQWWSRCNDYVPDWGDSWKKCNPDGDSAISNDYCQPAPHRNRHRTGFFQTDECNWTDYDRKMRCYGNNNAGPINAWRWHRNEGPNTGPRSVSCSDGRVTKMINCHPRSYKTTCRHYLN